MVSAVKAVQVFSCRTKVLVLTQLLTFIIDYTILAKYLTFAIKKGVEDLFFPPVSLYVEIHDHNVTLWKKSEFVLNCGFGVKHCM